MNKAALLAEMTEAPWAMMPERLSGLVAAVQSGAVSEQPRDGDAMLAAASEAAINGGTGASRIAILPLQGFIMQKGSFLLSFFGGTTTQGFAAAFRQVLADDTIKGIIIEIDSPGGIVYGIQELAEEIYNARGAKPIVAVVNSLAASAAYWIASAADHIAITPSGEAGSIGVWSLHVDFSEALAKEGIKPTYISAGKYKVEGNSFEPMSDEFKEFEQSQIDSYYDDFVTAVARGRGAGKPEVRKGYGQGRVLVARDALKERLVDRIATLDEVVARMQSGKLRLGAQSLESTMTFEEHAESVVTAVSAFAERARDRAEFRAEEGRTLSAANREQLSSLSGRAKEAALEIDALLDETDPDKGRAEYLRFLQSRARELGVAV